MGNCEKLNKLNLTDIGQGASGLYNYPYDDCLNCWKIDCPHNPNYRKRCPYKDYYPQHPTYPQYPWTTFWYWGIIQ